MSEQVVTTSSPTTTQNTSAGTPAPRMTLRQLQQREPVVSTPVASAPKVAEPARAPAVAAPADQELADAPAASATTHEPEALELDANASDSAAIDFAAKYREIMDGGDLHKDLYGKHLIAKVNGKELPVTVEEALKGYQRHSDYSRAMNEAQNLQRQVQAEQQKAAQLWQALGQNHQLALEVFEDRFGPEYVDQLVAIRQQAAHQYESGIQAAGIAACLRLGLDPNSDAAAQDNRVIQAMRAEKDRLDAARRLERENAQLKRKQAEFDAAQQQTSQQSELEEYTKQVQTTVNRFSDAALKANGIRVNGISKQRLFEKACELMAATRQPDVTQRLVMEAAQILRDDLEDAKTANAAEPPLPARTGAGGGVAPSKPLQGSQRQTIRDISKRR